MSRKPPKIKSGLSRFVQSVFLYFHDRGMPVFTAKVRMFNETYDVLEDFYKKENDVPDHVLVSTLQHASRQLNNRGSKLAKKLSEAKDPEEIASLRAALSQIKKAKDDVDVFITTYRGEQDGQKDS
jgi:predicted  nucleic acid-binding Zn-ribbon protein